MTIDRHDKLSVLETNSISRNRRRETESYLENVESKAFSSINSSVDWPEITASLFCLLCASMFQQTVPAAIVADLWRQATRLKKLKRFDTTTCYNRLPKTLAHAVSLDVLSNAKRSGDSGQLGNFAGMLLAPLQPASSFHVLLWNFYRARPPVRSISAAKTLATEDAIDIGKSYVKIYKHQIRISFDLINEVDSKTLFLTLFTLR